MAARRMGLRSHETVSAKGKQGISKMPCLMSTLKVRWAVGLIEVPESRRSADSRLICGKLNALGQLSVDGERDSAIQKDSNRRLSSRERGAYKHIGCSEICTSQVEDAWLSHC